MRPPASSLHTHTHTHTHTQTQLQEALLSLLSALGSLAWEPRGGTASAAGWPRTPSSAQLLLKLPEAAALYPPSPPSEPGEAFADLGEGALVSERWAVEVGLNI